MSNPHEWHIASDLEGFFIEDEFGEDLTPTWRSQSFAAALRQLDATVRYALDNYEPPDPPGFEGGFAPNH